MIHMYTSTTHCNSVAARSNQSTYASQHPRKLQNMIKSLRVTTLFLWPGIHMYNSITTCTWAGRRQTSLSGFRLRPIHVSHTAFCYALCKLNWALSWFATWKLVRIWNWNLFLMHLSLSYFHCMWSRLWRFRVALQIDSKSDYATLDSTTCIHLLITCHT